MKKKYPLILFITAALSLYRFSAAADDFGQPWNSTVKTGDALIETSRSPLAIRPAYNGTQGGKCPFCSRASKANPIYNGVQGGAYILIRFFQVAISPQDGPSCRFSPTCSAYGRQAVQKFGAFFGALMAGDRLIRCNPYNPPGSDPLPDKLKQ